MKFFHGLALCSVMLLIALPVRALDKYVQATLGIEELDNKRTVDYFDVVYNLQDTVVPWIMDMYSKNHDIIDCSAPIYKKLSFTSLHNELIELENKINEHIQAKNLYIDRSSDTFFRSHQWNIGLFTGTDTHASIVQIFIKKYIIRQMLLRQFDHYLESINNCRRHVYTPARSIHIPLAKAYLSHDNILLRLLTISQSMHCTAREVACSLRKNEIQTIVNKLLYSSDYNLKEELEQMQVRILNYQPLNWSEAEQIKSIYLLNSIYTYIKTLSTEELLSIYQDINFNDRIRNYMNTVIESTVLPTLTTSALAGVLRANVSFYDLNESLQFIRPLTIESAYRQRFLSQLFEEQMQKLNILGNFYLEKQDEIMQ